MSLSPLDQTAREQAWVLAQIRAAVQQVIASDGGIIPPPVGSLPGTVTAAQLDAALQTMLVAGANITITHDGTAHTFTIATTGGGGTTAKYSAAFGDGTSTSYTITHGLGTTDVVWSVEDASTHAGVSVACTAKTSTTLTLSVSPAPATNALRITIIG